MPCNYGSQFLLLSAAYSTGPLSILACTEKKTVCKFVRVRHVQRENPNFICHILLALRCKEDLQPTSFSEKNFRQFSSFHFDQKFKTKNGMNVINYVDQLIDNKLLGIQCTFNGKLLFCQFPDNVHLRRKKYTRQRIHAQNSCGLFLTSYL